MALTNCELIDCNEVIPDLYTTAALTPAITSLLQGISVVQLAEYPNTCFRVIKPVNPVAPAQAYTIANVYSSSTQVTNCTDCKAAIELYLLEDCLEDEDSIYSFSPGLSVALNKVVHLEGYEDVCWKVLPAVYDEQITEDVVIAVNESNVPQIFDDCICCLPTPPEAPVKYVRSEPKADRTFYKIAQSQCDITANIKFANAYYNIFKQIRYGIASNCEVDEHKILLKKELSDLATLYDPTACIITTPVTPVICPEPTGNPFTPPTYTFGIGDRSNFNQGTFGCTTCLNGTIPELGFLCPSFNIILDYNILDNIEPDSVYVFSYNGNCIITQGSFINTELFTGYPTYTMTSANIVNAGFAPASPCESCAS
jgi:hypothetical protein